MERIAPLWFLPIILSISKSPNRSFGSTTCGRCSISILLGIKPRPAFFEPRWAYLRPCLRRNLKRGKKYLLIIDEVFDYLDDANVIAAQYYISNLLKDEKYEIYPIIFTHLDPKYFRNYIFKPSLLNVQYLKNVNAVGSVSMKSFITYREGLDKSNPTEMSLYDDLSKYFFHYSPNTIDRNADIHIRPNLKITWAKDTCLKEYVLEELNKYFSAATQYDPYAVSLGIRYRIEKVMYDSFAGSNEKDEFINTHQTDKKLKYEEEHSALVPDAYYYLSAIHN